MKNDCIEFLSNLNKKASRFAFAGAGEVEETSLARGIQKGEGLGQSTKASKYAGTKLDQLLTEFSGRQFKIGREHLFWIKKV